MMPLSCEPYVPTSSHDVVDSGNTNRWNSNLGTVLKRHGTAERGVRARSYPPAGKLPVTVDVWFGLAPLASPETLSDSSSLASCGSSSAMASVGYQRVMSSILTPRMDPILQSPARSSNSRDCCLHLESADVVGDLATLSPCIENLPSPLTPHYGPDIVPVPHFAIAAPSTISSSPDVVLETRLSINTAFLSGSEQRLIPVAEACHTATGNSSVESVTFADVLSGCELESCAYGNLRPDIVCTHDCYRSRGHDVVDD